MYIRPLKMDIPFFAGRSEGEEGRGGCGGAGVRGRWMARCLACGAPGCRRGARGSFGNREDWPNADQWASSCVFACMLGGIEGEEGRGCVGVRRGVARLVGIVLPRTARRMAPGCVAVGLGRGEGEWV